jgi:hypothetical protein
MYAVIFIAATVELAWYEVTREGAIRRIGQQSARAMGLCSDGLGTALAVISAVVVGICGARPHLCRLRALLIAVLRRLLR